MQTKPRSSGILAASLLLVAASSFAPRAAASIYTLTPGNTIPASASSFPTGVGAPLGQLVSPFFVTTSSGNLSGTVTSDVFSGDTSNPYHGLTFTYSLAISNSSDSAIGMSADSFAGFQTDVSYNQSAGEINPSFFSRSSGTGDILNFLWFSPNLPPGDTGSLIVVQTDASFFAPATGGVVDGGGATPLILAPTLAPVPEPGVASLLMAALGVFFIFRRRNSA